MDNPTGPHHRGCARHGTGFTCSPQPFNDGADAGPRLRGVKLVHDVISDTNRTGLILTCLPEDLPVNETIELHDLRTADHGGWRHPE